LAINTSFGMGFAGSALPAGSAGFLTVLVASARGGTFSIS
jgi:hypothetical protein